MSKDDIFPKIDELISQCPKDWAKQASIKMNLHEDSVRKIKNRVIGKKDLTRQLELIRVLKCISKKYNSQLNKEIA